MNKFIFTTITLFGCVTAPLLAQNVGIGTNTPIAKLHVVDNSTTFSKILVDGNNTAAIGEIRIRNTSNNGSISFGYINNFNNLGDPNETFIRSSPLTQGLNIINQNGTGTGGHIGFYAGVSHTGIPTFYLSDNQNVGIGTETPSERLHVAGGGRFTALAGVGNRMVIADANGVLATQAIPAATTVNAENGLRNAGTNIRLGGPLIENTTITQAGFGLTLNLDGTGDFRIQDNGVTTFTVLDNGTTRFGRDVEWRDGNTGGTILATLIDDGNDGRFTVRENGNISIDLDANTRCTFNEQGLDRDFRIESNNNVDMFYVNAGTDRIGVGTANPQETIEVNGGARIRGSFSLGTTPYGTHKMMVTDATNPSVVIGNLAYNNVESGRLTFEEQAGTYPTAGAAFCGFRIHHRGNDDRLIFQGGCGADIVVMALERTGDVGLSTDNPTAELSVNGVANKTGGGNWAVFSDRRLKKDITDYQEGLSLITKVRTVNFSYNDKMAEIWGENASTKDKVYQGVIAQELQQIAPDMVREVQLKDGKNTNDADYAPDNTEDKGESFLEVDPNKFTYALINAVQEQQAMIEALKKEVEELKILLDKK